MMQLRKISDYGSSNPIVARLSVQTIRLCEPFSFEKEKRDAILQIYGFDVQFKLLECYRIREELVSEYRKLVEDIKNRGIQVQSHGMMVTVPSILRLEARCDSFLHNAKASLRELVKIVNLFYGTTFNSPRFDQVAEWAAKEFGHTHELTVLVQQDHELWIQKVVTWRNALEHPGGNLEPLRVTNVELSKQKDGYVTVEPKWAYGTATASSIIQDMETVIQNTLLFAEDLLVVILKSQPSSLPLLFFEVPDDKRDPKMPIRLQVTLDQSKLGLGKPDSGQEKKTK